MASEDLEADSSTVQPANGCTLDGSLLVSQEQTTAVEPSVQNLSQIDASWLLVHFCPKSAEYRQHV
jgi:hypothetical protein